ncbi:MAG TPA: PspA/IM30 family protein [Allosphingosinicella sp.]|jgi:phage shock protein A
MVDSIFVRVQRVLSSNVNVVVGAAERASGTSLMRDAIRQIERAEDEARAELQETRCRRTQAGMQKALLRDRIAALGEQARFAMSKDRPDLAEAAVARQIDHEAQVGQLDKAEAEAADEEGRLEECLAELKLRKAQMESEMEAFRVARGEAAAAGAASACTSAADRAERKAAQAETLFERAMSASGVRSAGLMEPKEAAKLAEVDALQREAAVADRLAAIKAAQDRSAGKGGKQAKRA